MSPLNPESVADDMSPPSSAATKLLIWLAVAVIFCLLGAVLFYFATKLTNDISHYRREMNTTAYNAQVFFDKREALLTMLSTSVVPSGTLTLQDSHSSVMHSIKLGNESSGQWTLYLSERSLRMLASLSNNLLYVDANAPYQTRALFSNEELSFTLPASILTQLIDNLQDNQAKGHPVYWLTDSSTAARRLYLFTPIGDERPIGWFGLEITNADLTQLLGTTGIPTQFLLISPENQLALVQQSVPKTLARALKTQQDSFGFIWNKGLPTHLALNKSLGLDDWRLVLYSQSIELGKDLLNNAVISGIICLLAIITLLILLRRMNRQVIKPAEQYYQQLADSVAFNGTLIQLAPIALCVIRCQDNQVILENQLARQWLGEDKSSEDWNGSWRQVIQNDKDSDTILKNKTEQSSVFTTTENRHLEMLYTFARYRGNDVLLCAFNDISSYSQAEAAWSTAKKAAEEANQAKSLFLATMSHEIRTPLYGVLGTLELLSLTQLNSQQEHYVKTIQTSSSILLQLINDVLDVSKIESGQTKLNQIRFSPLELTESTIRTYADTATRKGLQIYICVDSNQPMYVLGDAPRISQILNNLLNNAIKFTDSGRIFLRLRVNEHQGQQVKLTWQITDTGNGISQDAQKRLFEPFYQAGKHSNAIAGTGLGLTICAHLAHLMQGDIQVVSEVGLGSSFSLTLPLTVTEGDDDGLFPRLLPAPPVFVRSKSKELIDSACCWLRRLGATAHPLPAQQTLPSIPGAILVDIAPQDTKSLRWKGPRVTTTANGNLQPQLESENTWIVTQFSIRALAEAVALAQNQPTRSQEKNTAATDAPLALRVLIAEDNAINQMILKEQLQILGCTVELAENGKEALAKWQRSDFDLILTDVNMPGMDGYELVRRLRAEGCKIPILGATANASPADKERCLDAGMNDCLIKPVDMKQLRKALTQ